MCVCGGGGGEIAGGGSEKRESPDLDLQRLASLTVLMYFNLRSGSIFERQNVWKLLKLGR